MSLIALCGTLSWAEPKIHYQACVEVSDPFYVKPGETITARVWAHRLTKESTYEYLVCLFPAIWVNERYLEVIDNQICKDAEEIEDDRN
jgi:hypothetical protein